MRTVQVYIEGQRLDLFDDEQINVTSTQQNVQDISKVFTDFSQSFSVPASPINNEIFHHFYENDIGDFNDVNTLFDFNIRRNANIEIDFTPFRTGKISLEKAEVKNNKAYSYQITFYGDVISLKDKFGNDKLIDIKLNTTEFIYNASEVKTRIINGAVDYDIRFPLVFSRDVTYGDGGSNDLTTDGGAVKYNELFPALKVETIFAGMETKYGVTFNGTFLSTQQFKKAYLFCQNANEFVFKSKAQALDFTTGALGGNNYNNALGFADYFDLTNDTLNYTHQPVETVFPSLPSGYSVVDYRNRVGASVFTTSSDTYYLDVFSNGQLVQTIEGIGNASYEIADDNGFNNTLNRVYNFNVRGSAAMTINISISYQQEANIFNGSNTITIQNLFYARTTPFSLLSTFGVTSYLPDMTVEAFFKGILQMFNLTCYGTDTDVYQIEPLSEWYAKGAVVDITKYTDIESINIDRVKLYKNIEFKYLESESATNTIFKNLTSRGYGNTSVSFDYDGGDFKVELPFENMMMQKFLGTTLQIGETLNEDANAYTPKPLVMYQYTNQTTSFRFTDNTTPETLTSYAPFGQDLLDTNINYTLNFNADISTLLDAIVPNTLFSVYYQPYLSNLFNLKNRETSVKTNLPISLLTSLKLNDRLIIRDKRYMINDMKSNLTTGEVSFVLLNDFSDVISQGGGEPIEPLQPSLGAQCLDVRILFPNGAVSATITTSDAGVTITPSTLTTDGIVEVCIPANTDTLQLIVTEDDADNINTEDFIRLRTEEGNVAIYTLTVTYTYADGTTVANQIFIQQQP